MLFEFLITFGPEVMCDMNWPISMFSILNLSLSLKSGTSTEAHPEQILKIQKEQPELEECYRPVGADWAGVPGREAPHDLLLVTG